MNVFDQICGGQVIYQHYLPMNIVDYASRNFIAASLLNECQTVHFI